MSDRFALTLFIASCAVGGVIYGSAAAHYNMFPYPQFVLAHDTIHDVTSYWKNDYGFEPTRHLVDARKPHQEGEDTFRMYNAAAQTPGYTLVAGLSLEPDKAPHAAVLYDEAGNEVYRWPVDYSLVDPKGPRPLNVMLHGVRPYPDGSLVVAFDAGKAIARIDSCGQPMWVQQGGFHHSIEADDQGNLWSWKDEVIVELNPDTGAVEREIDLRRDIINAHDLHGVFSIHAAEEKDQVRYIGDAFHTNDVEPLQARLAGAFPMFKTGDLLISLRELNLVAVIDPDDNSLKWAQHGPWHRQHDPDWEPDGTISVFDNHMGLGNSRIMKIDPASREVKIAYEGDAEHPFYSYRRGKHQFLPNGNLLVTETEAGRIFEAAPDGSLVWEREFEWDPTRNVIITSAEHLPADFFEPGAMACSASVKADPQPPVTGG